MMKKRLLMPLLVAGMMVASVVSLDSCKKNDKAEIKTSYRIIEDEEMPVVEECNYFDRVIDYNHWMTCPYCEATLYANDTTHWHTFGVNKYGVPGEFPVDGCLSAYDEGDTPCPYSGSAYAATGDPGDMARYHAHRIYLIRNMPGWDGGSHNVWHVGGGIPGWTTPNP
jgi:hypothetical protein